MRRQNRFFWVCLAGTVLLVLGVIFLPRYFSRSLDMGSMGQVEVTGRDGFSFLEAGANDIPGVAEAFRYLEKSGDNPMLITSLEEPAQIDRDLTEQVYQEAEILAQFGMVPWLGIEQGYQEVYDWKVPLYMDWSECAKFARYYSLTYESSENPNKKEMMNLWYLRFSDDENFDYYFVVNAVTCQIYYAEIYNGYSENMALSIDEENLYDVEVSAMKGTGTDMVYSRKAELGEMFTAASAEYYGAAEYEYIGPQTLSEKIGIAILYFREDEDQETFRNVYLEVKLKEEPHLNAYRGISIGFQDLAGWVRFLQE